MLSMRPCLSITLEHKSVLVSDSMYFPVYICSLYMYPLVASLSTKTFIPHFVGLAFMYCLNNSLPLKGIIALYIVTC